MFFYFILVNVQIHVYNYVLNIDKVFVCTNYCNNKVPYVSQYH